MTIGDLNIGLAFNRLKLNPKNEKPFFGVGYYTKSNTEVCLLGIKGRLKPVSNKVSQVIIAPRREHSRKPDEVRSKIVELFGDLPRIELFSRQKTPGWDVWGNDTQKFCATTTNDKIPVKREIISTTKQLNLLA